MRHWRPLGLLHASHPEVTFQDQLQAGLLLLLLIERLSAANPQLHLAPDQVWALRAGEAWTAQKGKLRCMLAHTSSSRSHRQVRSTDVNSCSQLELQKSQSHFAAFQE